MGPWTHDHHLALFDPVLDLHVFVIGVTGGEFSSLSTVFGCHVSKVVAGEGYDRLNRNLQHILFAIVNDDSNLSGHTRLQFSDLVSDISDLDISLVFFQVRIRPAAGKRN